MQGEDRPALVRWHALRCSGQGPRPLPGNWAEEEGTALAGAGAQRAVLPHPQGGGALRGEKEDVNAVEKSAGDGEQRAGVETCGPNSQNAIERKPALRCGAPANAISAQHGAPAMGTLPAGGCGQEEPMTATAPTESAFRPSQGSECASPLQLTADA